MEIIVGVDMGGTSTKFGLVDLEGNVLYQGSVPTQLADFNDYIEGLTSAIHKGIEETSSDLTIKGIGMGAPNANYYEGTIEEAPNLPWKGTVRLVDAIEAKFGVVAAVTNDANAAAIGEMTYGAAKGMKDFVAITLGTGLGCGIVSNGSLVQGQHGFAGELGHVSLKPSGSRKCKCGNVGCVETYISATGLKRTVFKFLSDNDTQSALSKYSYDDLDTKTVADAANAGDQIAQEAFEYTAKMFGYKLADVVHFTNPEAIFVMGGLAQAGDLLFVPTRRYMNSKLMPTFRDRVKVLPSELDNQTTPIVGAASLIVNKFKKENSPAQV